MIDPEWISLISTVGFPIAFCLLMYFDLRMQLIKRLDKLESSLDDHIRREGS